MPLEQRPGEWGGVGHSESKEQQVGSPEERSRERLSLLGWVVWLWLLKPTCLSWWLCSRYMGKGFSRRAIFSHFVLRLSLWLLDKEWVGGQNETRRSDGRLSRRVVTTLPSVVAVGRGAQRAGVRNGCQDLLMDWEGKAEGIYENSPGTPSLKCGSRWRGLLSWKCLLDGQVEMPRQYSRLKRVWAGQESLPGNSWKVYLMPRNCVDSLKNRVLIKRTKVVTWWFQHLAVR